MDAKLETLSGRNLHGKDTKFRLMNYKFTSEKDKKILDEINKRGYELASKVNPAAANYGDMKRPPDRIIKNCVAGVLAEYCWKIYLNGQAQQEIVVETEYSEASKQIDLLIKGTERKIEVRSSFPRNGIEFAVFDPRYQFDILGPYSNTVKPGEIQKDYYVRVLYPFDTRNFFQHFNSSIDVYLCGGASWYMMNDNRYSKNKDLVPEDEFLAKDQRSTYRVVPLSLAYDTIDISKEIFQDSQK